VKPIAYAVNSAVPPPQCETCGLRATGAFIEFSRERVETLHAFRKTVMRCHAGGTIQTEHDEGRWIFTLYSGWAFRYKSLPDGRRQILNFLLPGDLIGLQEEFAAGATHGVDALTDVTLCAFDRKRFFEMMRSDPGLSYGAIWLSAREESMVDENLLSVGRRSAPARLSVLLVTLYRRAERVGLAPGGRVTLPFNQQHIADALGLSLVHTHRTLRTLTRMGLHRVEGGELIVLDPTSLDVLAQYTEAPLRRNPLL
jgi:CRP/FNR family transcriptional regulator